MGPLYIPQCGDCKFCKSPKTNLCGKIRATQVVLRHTSKLVISIRLTVADVFQAGILCSINLYFRVKAQCLMVQLALHAKEDLCTTLWAALHSVNTPL